MSIEYKCTVQVAGTVDNVTIGINKMFGLFTGFASRRKVRKLVMYGTYGDTMVVRVGKLDVTITNIPVGARVGCTSHDIRTINHAMKLLRKLRYVYTADLSVKDTYTEGKHFPPRFPKLVDLSCGRTVMHNVVDGNYMVTVTAPMLGVKNFVAWFTTSASICSADLALVAINGDL